MDSAPSNIVAVRIKIAGLLDFDSIWFVVVLLATSMDLSHAMRRAGTCAPRRGVRTSNFLKQLSIAMTVFGCYRSFRAEISGCATGAPVSGSRNSGCSLRSARKSNMFIMLPAVASNDPPPMR